MDYPSFLYASLSKDHSASIHKEKQVLYSSELGPRLDVRLPITNGELIYQTDLCESVGLLIVPFNLTGILFIQIKVEHDSFTTGFFEDTGMVFFNVCYIKTFKNTFWQYIYCQSFIIKKGFLCCYVVKKLTIDT
ncbi:MAG: hypothetical protein PHC95_02325 [Parabacteroides sp.]|nr:hypothetical protein [Parabacteroides sp.]